MKTRISLTVALLLLLTSVSQVAVGQFSWVEANGSFSSPAMTLAVDSSGALFAGGAGFVRVSRYADPSWTALSFPSGATDIRVILFPQDHSLLLGCYGGLYRSVDSGNVWQKTVNGTVNTMTMLDNGVILLSRTRYLFRSTDNGATAPLVAGTQPWGISSITALARAGGSRGLVGTTTGMYMSTDGGLTWSTAGNWTAGKGVKGMAYRAPGKVFAWSDSAFFFTADSGVTWIEHASSTVPVKFLAPLTDSVLFAGTSQNGLLKSTDQGVSWTSVSGMPSNSTSALATDSYGRVFASFSEGSLLRSDDAGTTWEKLSDGLKGMAFRSVVTTASGAFIAGVSGYGLVRSADQGGTWGRTYSNVSGNSFVASRSDGTIFAALDESGFLRSTDDGRSWISAGTVSAGTTFHSLAFSGGGAVLAGTGSGMLRTTDNGTTWLASSGVAGEVDAIVMLPTGSLVAGGASGLFKSTDGGGVWAQLSATPAGVLGMTLTAGGKLLAGTASGVFVSIDSGSTWSPSGLNGTPINVLSSPIPSISFAGGTTGLFYSSDQGSSWNPAGVYSEVLSLDISFAGHQLAGRSSGLLKTTEPIIYGLSATAWMAAGALQDWFSAKGCEIEEGRIPEQQDGLRWPAILPYQDMKASKGLWIGTTNFADQNGTTYAHKVVHVGPRVEGTDEFIPISFERRLRFQLPQVTVDGIVDTSARSGFDVVDPTITGDQEIRNEVNTAIGITVTRRMRQFSQPFHDNYIIHDYTFTNTGRRGVKNEAVPGVTLTGVYFYFLNRLAICADTRYVIGNPTGWGINTMLDVRGDGYLLPTTGGTDTDDTVNIPGVYSAAHMRAQFAWHGKYPAFTRYDNIGGPIWDTPYYDRADTVGRLGAAQFVGRVTLHADKSAVDSADDPAQPSTTSWEGSDEPLTSGNYQYDAVKMDQEYAWMSKGHKTPRHAWAVEPGGAFDQPTGDPALGTPGGYSTADGYGPYTLALGQSVHIVFAEGASGLSTEKCISIGKLFKQGLISAKAKDDSVLSGKDSLFQTFRRAMANYMTGYQIPQPPLPPSQFTVSRDTGSVRLSWNVPSLPGPQIRGYEIYRSEGKYSNPYTLVHAAGPDERTFLDVTAVRGVAYYYYIVSVGDPADNSGSGLTPGGALRSGRYFTQTYEPVYVITSAPVSGQPWEFALAQNYPNPFNPATTIRYSVTGRQHVVLSVYDILGREVVRLVDEVQEPGEHGVTFDGTRFATGVYIYRLEAEGRSLVRSMLLLK